MPFLGVQLDVGETVDADGAIVDMLDTLSINLNFTYIHGKAVFEKAQSLGLEFNIYTTYDLSFQAEQAGTGASQSSYPIYTTSDIYVVPPGQHYTSWEKLLLPFDWQTWMWLGITFAAAFLAIFVIKVSKSTSLYS